MFRLLEALETVIEFKIPIHHQFIYSTTKQYKYSDKR